MLIFYNRFKTYLHNSAWIMGERILAIFLGFFVTVLVARYLGPKEYGVLSYAISMVTLFSVAGHMGLGGLVVREIIKKPDQRGETLGTALGLKLFGVTVAFCVLLVYALLYEGRGSKEFLVLMIIGLTLFFKPIEIIDFWFQAYLQAKYAAIARGSSLALASVLKVLFVFFGLSLMFFAWVHLLQAILCALFLLFIYVRTSALKIKDWNFDFIRAKELFGQGWIIYLASFCAVIYMKVDQVMLRWLVGAEDVGIYAVAAQLSEAWYFVPAAIVTSFFPKLIKLKKETPDHFNTRLQQIFDILFVLALSVACVMSFFSEPIIKLFFGEHYLPSAAVLVVHIWAALFIFMRAAFSKWILIEDMLVFSLITQGCGALANVGLNLWLIPAYGGVGAAYATLISYAMASYFALLLHKKTRVVFWMMSRAMLAPVRYPLAYISMVRKS